MVVLYAVGLIGAAVADDQEEVAQGACRADIEKLCRGVKPGQGRIAKCLRENRENRTAVSPACQARLVEVRERIRERLEGWSPDVGHPFSIRAAPLLPSTPNSLLSSPYEILVVAFQLSHDSIRVVAL